MSYLLYSSHKPPQRKIVFVLQCLFSGEMESHCNNEFVSLQCLKANLEDKALFRAVLKSRSAGCLQNLPTVLSPISSLKICLVPKFLVELKYIRSVFTIGQRYYDIWKDLAAYQVWPLSHFLPLRFSCSLFLSHTPL